MKKKVLKQQDNRIFFIDLLKFISILFFVLINGITIVSKYNLFGDNIKTEDLENLENILYMFTPTIILFLMGACVYIKNEKPIQLLKRGLIFIVLGQLIYVLTNLSSIFQGLKDIDYFANYLEDFGYGFLSSNIFYFAGLFYLFYALIKKLNCKPLVILIIAGVVTLVGNILIGKINMPVNLLSTYLGNLVYINEYSTYCFTLWLVFPLLGIVFQFIYNNTDQRDRFMKNVGILGILGFILVFVILLIAKKFEYRYLFMLKEYYKMNIISFLLIFTLNMAYISAMYFISKLLEKVKLIKTVVFNSSMNITGVFCLQLILFTYASLLISFAEKASFDYFIVFFIYYLAILFISILAAYLLQPKVKYIFNKEKNKDNQEQDKQEIK